MILGFFFLFHFLETLEGREGFFAKKGGVSLVRNRDLRPAAKANPTIQQAFERFQKYNRLRNLSQGSLDFYAAKGRSFFRFLGDTEQPITIPVRVNGCSTMDMILEVSKSDLKVDRRKRSGG